MTLYAGSAKYDIFEKLIEKQLSFFWHPGEVDVSRDRIDYQALPEHEKHIFISNLKYQTLLDSVGAIVQRGTAAAYLSAELEASINASVSEQIHSRSYAHIIGNSLTIRLLCLTISSPTSRSRNIREEDSAVAIS
ncbi:ribonucleotide-diphosphate reductase subunit beta [Escherichia coli]